MNVYLEVLYGEYAISEEGLLDAGKNILQKIGHGFLKIINKIIDGISSIINRLTGKSKKPPSSGKSNTTSSTTGNSTSSKNITHSSSAPPKQTSPDTDRKVKELTDKLQALEKAKEDAITKLKKEYDAKLQDMRNTHKQTSDDLANANAERTRLAAEYKNKREAMEKRFDDQEKQIDELRGKLAGKDNEIGKMRGELFGLRNKYQNSKEHNQALRNTLADENRRNKTIRQVRIKPAAIKGLLTQMTKLMQEYNTYLQKCNAYAAKLSKEKAMTDKEFWERYKNDNADLEAFHKKLEHLSEFANDQTARDVFNDICNAQLAAKYYDGPNPWIRITGTNHPPAELAIMVRQLQALKIQFHTMRDFVGRTAEKYSGQNQPDTIKGIHSGWFVLYERIRSGVRPLYNLIDKIGIREST